jgi:hypothetical protein
MLFYQGVIVKKCRLRLCILMGLGEVRVEWMWTKA